MASRIRSLPLAALAFVPRIILAQSPATSLAAPALTPPVAAVRPHRFDEHGTVRIDPYYWLKERSNPEVIKYLEDENAYTKAVMAHTAALQDRLYEELEIMIDGNVLAEGKPTFIIRAWDVSSAEDILAFAVDTTGGRVGIPRERGHEYSANHFGDYFYILSNDHAKNFRLIRTPVARPGRDNWEEVIPHRPECCSRTSSSSATTSC